MNTENFLALPDGRKLAYAEFGQADGHTVLYFHGVPSSRLEPLLIGDEALIRLGLRVIAPDRPGIGGSDFQPGRGFSHWPSDVACLADALGLGQFAVLGNSGGGPYVAACAARIPDRLRAAVIVSGGWRMDWPEATNGLPFVNRLVMILARRAPFLLRLVLSTMGGIAQSERDKELKQFSTRMPPADYAAIEKPGRLEAFGTSMRECMRQGTKGVAWDMGLYVREFDFRLDEVRTPLVWFHGEQDMNAPIALVRRVVAGLPAARLVTYQNEAHLSTLCNHFDEIAHALMSQPQGNAGVSADQRILRHERQRTEFSNVYDDDARARAYAALDYPGTYFLAYRDLPAIIAEHVTGCNALDFGCGAGRSTRFLRELGFNAIGIDISASMIERALVSDPGGTYLKVDDGDFSALEPGHFDLVLSAFAFDNIPRVNKRSDLLRGLKRLLRRGGRVVLLGSTPDIYTHEWASFTTKDFPENRDAKSGDSVRIVMKDVADRRPIVDLIWFPEDYVALFAAADLKIVAQYTPLGRPGDGQEWVNEISIAPWVIYVLEPLVD